MQLTFLSLILVSCLIAAYRWNWGFFAAVLIGLIQDPIRKLIPEASGLYAMSAVPIWMVTLASGIFTGRLKPGSFINTFPRLGQWISIFACYLIIPAVISVTYGAGTWQITLLGALIYSLAIITLFAGSSWPSSELMRSNFLSFYALVAGIALVGGPLEYWLGSESHPVLGTAALGATWVTHRTGEAIYMLTGFFRGPDIMGWHASMVFMIASIFAIKSRGAQRYVWIGLAIWSVMSMWICGRRKIISMIPIFFGYFAFLFFYFRGARRLISALSLIVAILGISVHVVLSFMWETEVYEYYMSAFTEAGDQFKRHGFDGVIGTIEQAGFWGYGLGMGMQGTHHLAVDKPKLWQESGPTKLVAELGIPGTILLLMIFVMLFITGHAVLKSRSNREDFIVSAGIMSILVANLVAAVVSAQIYTDPFIALLLAIMTGLLLSSVKFKTPESFS